LASNLEIILARHEGVNAALHFIESNPTSGSFVLALGYLVRAGQRAKGSAIRALIKRKKRYFSDFFKPAFAATFRPDFAR